MCANSNAKKAIVEQLKTQLGEQYLQILDAIHEPILVKGPQSRIIWANRAFREFYGMSNEQLKGIVDAPFAEPDYTQQYVKDDSFVFSTARVLEIPREPVVRHDGVIRYWHTVKSPIFDKSGRVIMTVGVSRDVTERELQEKLINEQRAKMANSAKMSALGEMASNIAHEVANPLSAILLESNFLRQQAGRGDVPSQVAAGISGRIDAVVKRIHLIIQGLQFYSRGADAGIFEKVSLRSIIDKTTAFCKERFRENLVELRVDEFVDVEIECRPVEISQVLLNLLNNAVDATESAKVRWARVNVEVGSESVQIRVSDSGLGLEPQARAHLFEPFFTTKPVGKGTGLGLTVSHSIIRGHHGSLRLDRNSNVTCFVIELPKLQEKQSRKIA